MKSSKIIKTWSKVQREHFQRYCVITRELDAKQFTTLITTYTIKHIIKLTIILPCWCKLSNCLIIVLNLLEPVLVISSLSSAKPMKKTNPKFIQKNKIKKIKEELTFFFSKMVIKQSKYQWWWILQSDSCDEVLYEQQYLDHTRILLQCLHSYSYCYHPILF